MMENNWEQYCLITKKHISIIFGGFNQTPLLQALFLELAGKKSTSLSRKKDRGIGDIYETIC